MSWNVEGWGDELKVGHRCPNLFLGRLTLPKTQVLLFSQMEAQRPRHLLVLALTPEPLHSLRLFFSHKAALLVPQTQCIT